MLGVWRGLHSSFSRGYHLPEVGLGGFVVPEATRKGKTPAGSPRVLGGLCATLVPNCGPRGQECSTGVESRQQYWHFLHTRGPITHRRAPSLAGRDAQHRAATCKQLGELQTDRRQHVPREPSDDGARNRWQRRLEGRIPHKRRCAGPTNVSPHKSPDSPFRTPTCPIFGQTDRTASQCDCGCPAR